MPFKRPDEMNYSNSRDYEGGAKSNGGDLYFHNILIREEMFEKRFGNCRYNMMPFM